MLKTVNLHQIRSDHKIKPAVFHCSEGNVTISRSSSEQSSLPLRPLPSSKAAHHYYHQVSQFHYSIINVASYFTSKSGAMPSRVACLSSRPTQLKALPGGLVFDSRKTPLPRRRVITGDHI